MRRLHCLTGLILLLFATQVFAGQFEQGAAAANRGDYATALKIWRPLAWRGDVKAQFNLGVMYHQGLGVRKNDRETAKWWHRAAERGYARAQTNLGNMYQYGLGVPKNYKAAAKWYRHAASKGDAQAQYNLGFMAWKGIGIRRNNHQAMHWFRRAANRGDVNAQFNLGVMYEHGQGVTRNRVAAYALYNLIVAQHHQHKSLASAYRDSLARKLPARAIRTGKALTKRLLVSRPMTRALDAYLAKHK
ncbi:MAG: tetratricopeptide repeat protein [Gammaproteobacteria bacterium]